MKVLLDTNIVLDMLLKRNPFVETARSIFQHHRSGHFQGFLTATTVTDIYYVSRKVEGRTQAIKAVDLTLKLFEICPVNRDVLNQALSMAGIDFEDDLQISAAMNSELDAIVTRDERGFAHSPVQVLSAENFLKTITKPKGYR